MLPSLFFTVLLACGNDDLTRYFALKLGDGAKKFQNGTAVTVEITAKNGYSIDSVNYFLSGKNLPVVNKQITLGASTLGTHQFKAILFTSGQEITLQQDIVLLSDTAPEIFTYEILNTYPHDSSAFTQGLEFVGDTLYETTGINGESSLRKVEYTSGKVLAQTNLKEEFFGEGLTILGDTLFMLTWRSGKGFLYDPTTLEALGQFNYGDSKEGWGLCNDGETLFKSDGSQYIWKLDPKTLKEIDRIETVTNKAVFNKTNELEYVSGKIYANVWQKPSMMIIDAASGAITGVINFSGLEKLVTQHEKLDVLNGVAYHRGRNTFFVTGKRWDKLFEVRILKREP